MACNNAFATLVSSFDGLVESAERMKYRMQSCQVKRVKRTYPSLSKSEKASRNSLMVSSVRSTEPRGGMMKAIEVFFCVESKRFGKNSGRGSEERRIGCVQK